MIQISDAELLSLNHEFRLFGEVFNFSNLQTFVIRGRIESPTPGEAGSTVSIYSQLHSLISSAEDWQPVTVNGVNLGSGRISSIDTDAGLDVVSKPYSITLECLKSGSLHNMSGSYYNTGDLADLASNAAVVEDIKESFSFNTNTDGTYDYTRSVNVNTYTPNSANSLSSAQNVANILFLNDPSINLIAASYPNFYVTEGNKIHQEVYDLVNGSYSFTESYRGQSAANYTWTRSNTVTLRETDSEVEEQGVVQSVRGTGDVLFANARLGFTGVVATGIYARCQDTFSAWNALIDTGNTGCVLNSVPISRSIFSNEYIGAIEYNYTYSSDANITGCMSHEYNININEDNNIHNVSENGVVKYICSNTGQFGQVLDFYQNSGITSGILGRVEDAYTGSFGAFTGDCSTTGSLKLITQSVKYNEPETLIEYDYSYTDDKSILDGDPILHRANVKRETTYPVHFINNFIAVNAGEFVQPTNQSVTAQFNNQINLIAHTGVEFGAVLNRAFDYIEKPDGDNSRLVSLSYSWGPESRALNLSANYNYNEYKEFEDIIA